MVKRRWLFFVNSLLYLSFVYCFIQYRCFVGEAFNKYTDALSIAIVVLAAFLSMFIVIQIKRKLGYFNISEVIVSILKGESKGIEFLVVFIFSIVMTSWFSDYLGRKEILDAIASLVFLTLGILIYIRYSLEDSSQHKKNSQEPIPTKVLILALSNLRKENKEKIDKCKTPKEKLDFIMNKKNRINFKPPLEIINMFKDELKYLIVLVSEESSKNAELFKDLSNCLVECDTEITNTVDFDNYNEILEEIEYRIKRVNAKGYSDDDITIFISSGTSAVTAALVMAAVREGRQVVYYQQKEPYNLKAFNISIDDLKRFIREMGFR